MVTSVAMGNILSIIINTYLITKFGTKFAGKAEIAGGIILILMGLKILLEHLGVISF